MRLKQWAGSTRQSFLASSRNVALMFPTGEPPQDFKQRQGLTSVCFEKIPLAAQQRMDQRG